MRGKLKQPPMPAGSGGVRMRAHLGSLRARLVLYVFCIMTMASLFTSAAYVVMLSAGWLRPLFITQMMSPIWMVCVSSIIGTVITAWIGKYYLSPVTQVIAATKRVAKAEGTILMHPETQAMVLQDRAKKGDVLACARVAGIMAIKRTSDIIPMCHPLLITKSKCDIAPIAAAGTPAEDVPEGWAPARTDGQVGFHVLVTAGVTGKTGIEMEAPTGASAACLTIYDMCKAVDRGMEIMDVRLLKKDGGKTGLWLREEHEA